MYSITQLDNINEIQTELNKLAEEGYVLHSITPIQLGIYDGDTVNNFLVVMYRPPKTCTYPTGSELESLYPPHKLRSIQDLNDYNNSINKSIPNPQSPWPDDDAKGLLG